MEEARFAIASAHGRFQILHNEHLEYILAAKARCAHLIIGITSFNIQQLKEVPSAPHRGVRFNNPLTYYERTQMINGALVDSGLAPDSFSFVPFPIETPELISDFVTTDIPCFTTVREPWNREKVETLRRFGYKVLVLWERLEKSCTSSEIRRLIVDDSTAWRDMVPAATIRTVESLGIRSRLIHLAQDRTAL